MKITSPRLPSELAGPQNELHWQRIGDYFFGPGRDAEMRDPPHEYRQAASAPADSTRDRGGATHGARQLVEHQHRVDELGVDLVRQIESYSPRFIAGSDFERIEMFVKELVADTANLELKSPACHLHAVASFVHWATNLHAYPLDRAGLLTAPLILAFTEGALTGKNDGYVANVRSQLLGVAARANPVAVVPLPTKKRRSVNNPPYTEAELDRFETTARGLGGEYRRRSCLLTIALSAGAGLNPVDYVRLRNQHIRVDDDGPGIVVQIPQGASTSRTSLRARRVAVLSRWEPPIRDLMSMSGLAPGAFAVWENVIDSRENLSALTSGMKRAIPNDNNRPFVSRLRTSWMVHHLRIGTPIAILTEAAGLNSAESLFRYMPYVDLPTWETQRLYLRGGAATFFRHAP